MNIDRHKQMQDRLRHRRERRSGNRQAAEAAAETEAPLPPAAQPTSPRVQPKLPSAPLATLGDAFAAAAPPQQTQQEKAPAKDKPLTQRQIRARLRAEVKGALEHCRNAELCELMRAAEAGDAAAQFVLAERYKENGYEEESIIPLLRSAAEQGFIPAVGLYGYQLARNGERARSEEMLRQAADFGYGEGAYLYALLLEQQQQKPEAYHVWLKMAAEAAYVPAYRKMAEHVRDIRRPKSFNYCQEERAAYWLKKAADAGDAECAYLYAATATYHRLKVSENTVIRYFRLAFDNGYTQAVFPLAKYHRRHIERPTDTITYYEKGYYRIVDTLYKTIIGDCERAVEVYLEAAARAPELREKILADAMILHIDSWKSQHMVKVLQGLAEMGYAPATAELDYIQRRLDSGHKP